MYFEPAAEQRISKTRIPIISDDGSTGGVGGCDSEMVSNKEVDEHSCH